MKPNEQKTPATSRYEYVSVYLVQRNTGLYYLIDPDGSELSMPNHGISTGSSLTLNTLFDLFGKDGWELVSFLPEASIENRSSAYLAIFKRRYTIKTLIDWKYDVWLPTQGILVIAWMLLAPFLYFNPLSLQFNWLHLTGIQSVDFILAGLLVIFPLFLWIYVSLSGLWNLLCWLGSKIYDSMYENLESHYLKKKGLIGIEALELRYERNHFIDGIHLRVKLILLVAGVTALGLIYIIDQGYILYIQGKI